MTVPTGARRADPGIELDLPKPPGGFRLWLERHPRLVDAAVMLTYGFPQFVLVIAVAVSAVGFGGDPPGVVLAIGAAVEAVAFVATTVLLMLRRRFPVALFVAATAGLLPAALGTEAPIFLFAPWAVMIAIYTLATTRGTRPAVIAFAVASALSGAGTVVLMLPGPGVLAGGFSAVFMALLYASALLAGTTVGGRRRYVAALVQRAEQLARERDQQARIATQAERSRIAGEMHDIIAHSLSVVVRLADGAEAVIDQDPAAAKRAIHLVSDTGRSSLAEMRRLLGVLRDDEAADGPAAAAAAVAPAAAPGGGAGLRGAFGGAPAGGSQEALNIRCGEADPRASAGPDRPLRTESSRDAWSAGSAGGDVDETRHPAPAGSRDAERPHGVKNQCPPPADGPETRSPGHPRTESSAPRPQYPQPSPQPRPALEPQPRLEQLPALLERYRAAGLPVRLEQRGAMPTSVGVQLAIYRAIQEGLTNALRYARSPGHVTARILAHESGAVEVEVVDDGLAGPPAASVGMGRGLIGMRQRAALYGGSVESGPLPGRGWRVRMTLPQAGDDAAADAGRRPAERSGATPAPTPVPPPGPAPAGAVAPAAPLGPPSSPSAPAGSPSAPPIPASRPAAPAAPPPDPAPPRPRGDQP